MQNPMEIIVPNKELEIESEQGKKDSETELSGVITSMLTNQSEELDDDEKKQNNYISTEIQHNEQTEIKNPPEHEKWNQENIFAHTQIDQTNEYAKPVEVNSPSEQEIDDAIEQMSVKGICPPENLQPYIFQTLTRRRVDAICNSDYDLAEKQDKLSSVLNEYIKYQESQRKSEVRGDILYNRYLNLHSSLKEVNERYDNKRKDFIEQSNLKKAELITQQQELESKIYSKYADQSFLRQFSKASQKLAELRENEVNLAIQRNYAEAKVIKAEADLLEKQETELAQRRIYEQQQSELQNVINTYGVLIKSHDEKVAEQLVLIEAERRKECSPIEAAIKQIHVKTPSLPSLRPNSEARSGPAPAKKSPRTQMKLRSYISNKRPTVLPIQPGTSPMLKRQPSRSLTRKPTKK